MQIILLKDIKKLGNKNDIKNVADGYAMNFLIPKELAVAASQDRIKQIETAKHSEAAKRNKEIKEIKEIVDKLKDRKLILKEKASDKGKLYAAVSPAEIVAAIKKQLGVNLDPGHLKMKEHIKEVGEHKISLLINGKQLEIDIEVIGK